MIICNYNDHAVNRVLLFLLGRRFPACVVVIWRKHVHKDRSALATRPGGKTSLATGPRGPFLSDVIRVQLPFQTETELF